VQQEIAQRPFL